MNLKVLDITALKALAYDNLVQIEQCQKNIQIISQEINNRPSLAGIETVETPTPINEPVSNQKEEPKNETETSETGTN